MRKIKRNALLILLLAAVAAVALTFGISLTQEQRIAYAQGDSAESSNKIITAVISNPPAGVTLSNIQQIGTVTVGDHSIRLNGIDEYEIQSSNSLQVTATPGKHFEFDQTIKMTLRKISSTAVIEETINAEWFWLSPEEGYDYQIVVNFVPKTYTLTLETYYLDGTRANAAQTYFLANNQHSSVTVTWGTLNLKGRELEYTSTGENFRLASAKIQYSGVQDFDEIDLGNTLLNDYMLDNHIQPGETLKIHGFFTRMVAVNITSNIQDATRKFEGNIQIESNSRISRQPKIDNGIGTFYFDSGSSIEISVKNTGSFSFEQFVIGVPRPELGAIYKDGNLTSNFDIQIDFKVESFNLFLVGLDHLGGSVALGANASVTVTNFNGQSNTYYANHTGAIQVSALSTLQFHHNPNTLGQEYDKYPLYFIRAKAGTDNKIIDNLGQSIQVTDAFVDNHALGNNQIFFTIAVIKKFELTITLSSQFAGTVLFNGEVYNPSQRYFFFENESIVLTQTTNNYHTFVRFDGAPASFSMGRADINIHAVYEAHAFKIKETKNFRFSGAKDGSTAIYVGAQLEIAYSGNGTIKDWTINGKNLSHFGAKRNGRVVTVMITEEFINLFFENADWVTENSVLAFNNKVSLGKNSSVIIAIAIPSVAIPLSLCVLLLFILSNKKHKKSINVNQTTDATKKE